jgi:pyridoxine 5-phosphate synthase
VAAVRKSCRRFREAGIEVSLFIDPDLGQVKAAAETGAGFIELHTGAFAEHFHDRAAEGPGVEPFDGGGRSAAHALGLRVNAGHGLNYENVPALLVVPHLVELNIGHSLVSRAITVGLAAAVREMLAVHGRLPG